MRIAENKISFEAKESPVRENLSVEAQALIPAGYEGTATSASLANVYGKQLIAGRTVAELSSVEVDEVPENISEFDRTKFILARFGLYNKDTFTSLFYSLNSHINFDKVENAYYLAEALTDLSPLATNVGSTVAQLYSLNRGRDENGLVPVPEIRKFILLNKALRKEGVVITATEVFYCSLNWATDDVFSLIENGKSLSEALKMYDVGFTTVQEIVDYSDSIPTSWIDRILG